MTRNQKRDDVETQQRPTLISVPTLEVDESAPLPADVFESIVGAMADMLVADYQALTEPTNGSPTGSNHGR